MMAFIAVGGCSQPQPTIPVQSEPVVAESPEPTPPSVTKVDPTTTEMYGWKSRLAPLHQRMKPPQPGDWLAEHKESGQTFEQYLQKNSRPRVIGFSRIAIVPLGETSPLHQKIVERSGQYLTANFGLPVEILPTVSIDTIPDEARRDALLGFGEQLQTSYILEDVLPPIRPDDALAVLAMTAHDLWPGKGWNFVFGQASVSERVGVWSLARYGDPAESEDAYRLALERTIKVALHETGHMVGIQHCTAYNCGMNGSNNLPETDRSPVEFCPECQAKLWWTCRVHPVTRLRELAALAQEDGLQQAAEFWQKEADMLKDVVPAPAP
jgi:archaemetzincin